MVRRTEGSKGRDAAWRAVSGGEEEDLRGGRRGEGRGLREKRFWRRKGNSRVCGDLFGADGGENITVISLHLPTCLTTRRSFTGGSLGASVARRRNMRIIVESIGKSISWVYDGRRTFLWTRWPVSGLISGHRAAGDEGKRGVDKGRELVDQRKHAR
ncbi:hypothetical protein LIER_43931 [Lithospermum erythrorhizon]|uniref:Uncharacterized protein n=1 Tax=Lithospermum erythrorhizon TaxID=34254 RepID=A0AAV3R8F9_LITER